MPGPLGTTPATQSIAYEGEGGGGGAPTNAQYIVGSANATLTQELVVTGNTWIVGDTTTAGQCKFDIVAGSIGTTQITDLNVTTAKIAADAVTYAKIQNVSGANFILGRSSSGSGDVEEINLVGDVTVAGNVATIANDAVTYAKIQNVTDARILGRAAGSAGDCTELTTGAGIILSGGSVSAVGAVSYSILTANRLFRDAAGISFVNGLSFAVTSGVTYYFQFNVLFGTSAAADGPRFGLSFAGANYFSGIVRIPAGTAGTDSVHEGVLLASGTSVTIAAVNAANTYYLAQVYGIINPSSSTTLSLLSGVDTAGGSMNVRIGSFGRLETIA